MSIICHASRDNPPVRYFRLLNVEPPGPYYGRIESHDVFFCPWCCGDCDTVPHIGRYHFLCDHCRKPFEAGVTDDNLLYTVPVLSASAAPGA